MEITPELITQYGLMNKISTGNTYLDVVLCLLVPLLLKHLIPLLSNMSGKLWPTKPAERVFSRYIEHTQRTSYYWYDSDGQPPNSILQRALLDMVNRSGTALEKLPKVDVVLRKKPANAEGDEAAVVKEEEDPGSNEHAYTFNLAPPVGQWVKLKNSIRFMRKTENLDDKAKNTKTTYILECKEKDGNARINAFVEEALELYRKQQSAKVDPARYLYMPVLSGFRAATAAADGEEKSAPSAIYKRYKLSEDKTFASFFHPDKEAIVKLVDAFLHKKGKFAIPGYPPKLGFLLYGPPGTGKTSFIKALAQHTRRSVINVPLAKITTNQELFDIILDSKLALQNASENTVSLPFAKTIYVFEDVDAASTVVQRRAPAPEASPSRADLVALARSLAKSKRTPATASRDSISNDGEPVDDQGEDKDSKEEAEGKPRTPPASKGNGSNDTGASTSGGGGVWETGVGVGPSLFPKFFKGDDDLNLAGLLNVLDGVVDTPNRIVIMTTNHPEKLDPALIRPGRINKKIYMGRLHANEALSMIKHYFGAEWGTADEAALRQVYVDERLSPADLEAMCAEHDTPAELAAAIVKRMQQGADEPFRPC